MTDYMEIFKNSFWIGVGLFGTLSLMNIGIKTILTFFKLGIPKEGGV